MFELEDFEDSRLEIMVRRGKEDAGKELMGEESRWEREAVEGVGLSMPQENCKCELVGAVNVSSSGRMGGSLEDAMKKCLASRREKDLLRSVSMRGEGQVDFCSNDYLGLASCVELHDEIDREVGEFKKKYPWCSNMYGSTGSRLLTGHHGYVEDVERSLALFYNVEDCLIFNSGYDLNLGLLGSVSGLD